MLNFFETFIFSFPILVIFAILHHYCFKFEIWLNKELFYDLHRKEIEKELEENADI